MLKEEDVKVVVRAMKTNSGKSHILQNARLCNYDLNKLQVAWEKEATDFMAKCVIYDINNAIRILEERYPVLDCYVFVQRNSNLFQLTDAVSEKMARLYVECCRISKYDKNQYFVFKDITKG